MEGSYNDWKKNKTTWKNNAAREISDDAQALADESESPGTTDEEQSRDNIEIAKIAMEHGGRDSEAFQRDSDTYYEGMYFRGKVARRIQANGAGPNNRCKYIRKKGTEEMSHYISDPKTRKEAKMLECEISMNKEDGNVRRDDRRFSYKCIPDTGASITMMSTKIARKQGIKINKEDNKHKVIDASGERMKIDGSTMLWIRPQGSRTFYQVYTLVSEGLGDDVLISYNELWRWGSVPRNFPIAQDLTDETCKNLKISRGQMEREDEELKVKFKALLEKTQGNFQ